MRYPQDQSRVGCAGPPGLRPSDGRWLPLGESVPQTEEVQNMTYIQRVQMRAPGAAAICGQRSKPLGASLGPL